MEVKLSYKQTDVGAIPNDWDVKRLGDLGTVVRGGSPRPAGDPRYFNGGFIPWLTVGSLTNIPTSQVFITDTATKLTEEGAKHSRTLQQGTLVIVNSGAKTLGVSKVLSITCCANDGIAALVNQSGGEKTFLCYFLNSQIKRLREVIAAGNDQLNLNTGRIALIAVPFPEENEQRAIAEALTDVDALLGGLDQLIIKKRHVKQAAMQQLLTGQTRLPGFHGEWEVTTLGDVGEFLKGSGIKKDEVTADGLPCVRYGEIYTYHDDHIKTFASFITPETAKKSQRLEKGDLLFAGSGETAEEIGKCVAFLWDEEAYAGGDIVIFRPSDQSSEYLGYLMNHSTIATQKARLGQGDAIVHISARNLARLEVHLPTLTEQTAIAEVLMEMDNELAALEQRREKTIALKQAMTRELLTGRTRLV
ncbi:restriction endonuclease subunit S [Bradyrhizobium sp. LCT2]|uniref:restriction endonuclease subunit S n=1 Tax=Bradyrhizobium sp. LCT2 TaxID=2493093 RepID=UPI001374241E|nr:restriction endonuclease subunit S [Bradyrhizobium sp. LCT2]QHP67449.1 restriction endonuclease subunit S [Bradyrhizobium sp. LCT2]